MFGMLLSFALPALRSPKVWLVIGGIIAIIWVANWFIGIGEDRAMKAVVDQNERAEHDADLADLSFTDCLARRDDGQRVHFDFQTGKCVRD